MSVAQRILIDGNNLLFAMRAISSRPMIGRETLVRVIERWADGGKEEVTVVLDGPKPFGGVGDQLGSPVIRVMFSGVRTADDVIIDLILSSPGPGTGVVTSDKALGHLARSHRCIHITAGTFAEQLETDGRGPAKKKSNTIPSPEKPQTLSSEESKNWLEAFGFDADVGADDGEAG
jgi:hypothetical protein